MTELLGWWFHDGSGVLPHGDGRPIELGAQSKLLTTMITKAMEER